MTTHRVLVVADNEVTADFVRRQLAENGLLPDVVADGLGALREAYRRSYALAIVDVDIRSEPNGTETADFLRNLYRIPVVVFSMRTDGDPREQAVSAGAAAYLVRPQGGELWGLVSSLLASPLRAARRAEAILTAESSAEGSTAVWTEQLQARVPLPPGFAELSGKEWQIILDLIENPSALKVAEKRQRSKHTVHNHLKSIFKKLGVHSVAELLSLVIRISRQVPIV